MNKRWEMEDIIRKGIGEKIMRQNEHRNKMMEITQWQLQGQIDKQKDNMKRNERRNL